MNLQNIEMPVEEARQAFVEYRHAVRSAKVRQTNSEDAQIARCYRALSEGQQILNIESVMQEAGEDENGLPRLAVSRADERQVHLIRDWQTGEVAMCPPRLATRWRGPYAGTVFRFSFSVRDGVRRDRWGTIRNFRAIVPSIPPALRPPHDLRNYHILWEATWDTAPPKDPALLKHLSGPLYAVLATWDLTAIEQAVLSITRS